MTTAFTATHPLDAMLGPRPRLECIEIHRLIVVADLTYRDAARFENLFSESELL